MLDRRELMKLTAVGATAAALPRAALARQEEATREVPAVPGDDFPFAERTIAELQKAMGAGELSAVGLTRAYLRRIEETDQAGPELRSVLAINPEAEQIARRLDDERRGGSVRGALHGIPILLKDNLDTGDRMLTTAGSLALAGTSAPRDSTVAAKLREAGAVLLGKANLSEWANFRSTRSSSGWSAVGGQTRNPYVLDRNPCGSSSGSGAAASANLCAAAIGTETDGSIVCPSNANGLVGIKPTVGLVSRSGIVPISHTQDTAGPMARTVADAAAVLSAIAGADPRDPATEAAREGVESNYTRFLDPAGLRGARIGVVRGMAGFHAEVDALFEEALAAMKEAGAELVDPVELKVDGAGEHEWQVLLYEFKHDLETYLRERGRTAEVRTLKELIDFNVRHREREMPWFGQEIFEQAAEKGPLTESAYLEALHACRRITRDDGIDRVLAKHELDALVAPTGSPAWPTDWVNGDHFVGGSSSAAAVSGYPAVAVPMGFVHGLPVDVSFFGRAWSEGVLIRVGFAFEQATQARRPPAFRASLRATA
ncbi:MAG: amidase [Thermoanaerobaculia bacterium]